MRLELVGWVLVLVFGVGVVGLGGFFVFLDLGWLMVRLRVMC